jgi:hypothetical protein
VDNWATVVVRPVVCWQQVERCWVIFEPWGKQWDKQTFKPWDKHTFEPWGKHIFEPWDKHSQPSPCKQTGHSSWGGQLRDCGSATGARLVVVRPGRDWWYVGSFEPWGKQTFEPWGKQTFEPWGKHIFEPWVKHSQPGPCTRAGECATVASLPVMHGARGSSIMQREQLIGWSH